jgi:hypothetical protein
VNHKPGSIFEITIDRFSKSGNGIVENEQGEDHLNVGRIDGMQGDSVRVQYIGDGIAYCLEAERRGEHYNVSKSNGLIQDTNYRTPMNGEQKRNHNNLLGK